METKNKITLLYVLLCFYAYIALVSTAMMFYPDNVYFITYGMLIGFMMGYILMEG